MSCKAVFILLHCIAANIIGGRVIDPTHDSATTNNLGFHIPSANREEDEVVLLIVILLDRLIARNNDLH